MFPDAEECLSKAEQSRPDVEELSGKCGQEYES